MMVKHFNYVLLFLCVVLFTTETLAESCEFTQPDLVGKNGEKSFVTSPYGMRIHPVHKVRRMHTGTDLSSPGPSDCDQPVKQQAGCEYKSYGPNGGYGNQLKVDCGNGVVITYGHLHGYNPSTETMLVGTTGVSTGCHLHIEVFIDNKRVNPECVWGTGKNCPNVNVPTNLCNEEEREALKNHQSSIPGQPGEPDPPGGSNPDQDHGLDNPDTDNVGNTDSIPDKTGENTSSGGGNPIEEEQRENGEEPQGDPTGKADPTATKPRCESSTCISQDHINNAKHKNVQDDKVKSYVNLLKAAEECQETDLRKTNVTVYQQIEGEYENYPDAFCLRQGCAHVDNACR